MARIKRHLQALEVDALLLHALHRVLNVQLAGIFDRYRHAHLVAIGQLVGCGAAARHEGLDLVLDGVGQLEALAVEDLDAVVLRRIVRGGDDDATIAMQLAGEQGDRRRGDDARQQRRAAH